MRVFEFYASVPEVRLSEARGNGIRHLGRRPQPIVLAPNQQDWTTRVFD
jgi:hypothetical protein